MRRSTLAVGLLLAVLLPIPSPAEDAAKASDEASAAAPADADETKAAAPADANETKAAEGGKPSEAEASSGAAAEEPEEASGGEGEAAGEEGAEESASDEKEAAPEEASADAAEGEGESGEDEEEDEGGFGASMLDYANNTRTQFLTGLNGLLTWPADPVMATVNPPKAFDKAGYERRPLGFASGILLMVYRTFTGTLDLALAPGPIPVMSPVPRYKLVPGFVHQDE